MIIGIAGPMGSGKSTATKHLIEAYGFDRAAFADPIKKALMVAFDLSWEQVYGSEKEIPTDKLCGKTPRWAMQAFGTQYGRYLIHPDIWIVTWRRNSKSEQTVFEDIRFPNERSYIRDDGGYVIALERSGYEYDSSHESEAHSDLDPDFIISNDGNIEDLKYELDNVMNLIMQKDS